MHTCEGERGGGEKTAGEKDRLKRGRETERRGCACVSSGAHGQDNSKGFARTRGCVVWEGEEGKVPMGLQHLHPYSRHSPYQPSSCDKSINNQYCNRNKSSNQCLSKKSTAPKHLVGYLVPNLLTFTVRGCFYSKYHWGLQALGCRVLGC